MVKVIVRNQFHHCTHPELKTEEGYSADIVWTYIPGDICPHNVGTMPAQCWHNVRTMSAQHLTKDICRHNVRTISAQCPHYIQCLIYCLGL